MEFDRIRSYPGLTVEEVEEGDADDARPGADPHEVSGVSHLPSPGGGRVGRACGRRRLRDLDPPGFEPGTSGLFCSARRIIW
jgi:hypothetical protein